MKWNEFLRDYFTFTRKERIGLMILLLVIFGIWIFPKISRPLRTVPPDTSWIIAAKKLMTPSDDSDNQRDRDDLAYTKPVSALSGELKRQMFYFDPNTLSSEGWTKLGVPEKTIVTIRNYLKKGGHFSKPKDLKKIYGIHADEYIRLEPYIRIVNEGLAAQPVDKEQGRKKEAFSNDSKYSVDVNTADTSAFVALPGIGSKLASRIVNFRDKLGGFYSVEQIGEIYGLPDSAFRKIKPFLKLETNVVKKININTATKDDLKSHPYLKWNLANAIVEYRNQHGNFSSLEDLQKISLITSDVFEKIKFYLVL